MLDINSKTKSKYFSIDQIGSTISAPNFIKKLIAAGTNIHHEKNNPKKNNIPEAKKAGKIKLFSLKFQMILVHFLILFLYHQDV